MILDDIVIADLQALGLSALGSHVYLTLLRRGNWVTGYEIAKDLGVARANVYDTLRSLVHAGFAQQRTIHGGVRYAAMSFALVANSQIRNLAERIERLKQALPREIYHPNTWQGIGWSAFRDQVDAALKNASKTVRIGTSVAPIREIQGVLSNVSDPSISVVYGCWEGCPSTGCGVCHPPVTALRPWTQDPACLVIVDDHIGVGSWGSATEPIILATDYPAVVSGWRTLLRPES